MVAGNQTSMAAGNQTSMNRLSQHCTEFPPNVHSKGFTANYLTAHGELYTLPNLELQVVTIFTITQAFQSVFYQFGIPKFSSQVLAGLILSPTLLGYFDEVSTLVFSINSQEVLGLLAEFGYGLFMFVIGVKMDLGMINRTGLKALFTGAACVIAPLIVGMLAQTMLVQSYFTLSGDQLSKIPYVTATHCMTPFPVVACLLEELKIMNSEIGRLGMSTALVSDMFSVFLQFVTTMARLAREKKNDHLFIGIGSSIGYVIFVATVLRPAMLWIIRQTPENRPVKRAYVNITIILMLASGVLSHMYGQGFHFGPFIFGLAVPAGPPLGAALEDTLNMFASDVLLPIFVSTCAMRTDIWILKNTFSVNKFAQLNGVLILVTLAVKFLASLVGPLYCNMPFKDALAIALILSCKGVVNLAFYTDLRDNKTINDDSFALAMISIFVTANLVPVLVKLLYDPSRKYAGYQKRNIMHLKPNSELKILPCIHRSSNMPAIVNLLDAACPSKENPIAVYVLHLIELVGRASPVFISHQMQRKSASNSSYSDNVILYFNQFVRENIGAVSLNIFTAISPPKYMHEDICTLSLDKLVSLIVLPFHRRWLIDGSVESEDNAVRTLNCSVLETAPCSVGILVDRGHLGRSASIVAPESSFSVALIFLGGKDDREALAFAKRMTNDSTISLTVIRLVPTNEGDDHRWDSVLDAEELKAFRYHDVREGFVSYLEEVVKDGPQTALVLRSIAGDYDLIIVGRRHGMKSPQTAGLSEWSEFPELGTIGDFLASPDISCRASILVMQQQIMMT